jgi:ribonuclease BN (tRNA processing enzyme)
VRVTTVGTGTIGVNAERVCAGVLVELGDATLLIDCGPGILHRLASLPGDKWRQITHVAISHFHLDHHADLPALVFAWKYSTRPGRSEPLVVIAPPGIRALLAKLAEAHGAWLRDPGFPMVVHELQRGSAMMLFSGAALASLPVPHTEESVAYSVRAGSRRLVYTGDTGESAELALWARGCDLLIAECSLPEEFALPLHLTPRQCGELARDASPAHVALTHFYPPVEKVDIEAEVRLSHAGPLTLAYDGWSIELGEDTC